MTTQRLTLRLTFALYTLTVLTAVHAAPALVPTPPAIAAKAYILQDFDSGYVITASNADARVEPASLTKLMTAYITFKDLSTVDLVGVYPNYAEAERAWRGKAQATVDNAQMRYFVVHLHRLLEPDEAE